MAKPGSPLSVLFAELRRRSVLQVGGIYLVAAWLVIQVSTATFPVLLLPVWALRAVVVSAILGFPVALVLAWAFEITPEGVRRTRDDDSDDPQASVIPTRVRYALVLGVVLVTSGVGWAVWRHWLQPRANSAAAASSTERKPLDEYGVAVLYLDDYSPQGELSYLAEGLTAGLNHALSQIGPLHVVSMNGVKPFRKGTIAPDSIARILGVRWLVEGSVEPTDQGLSSTIQLVDGRTGLEVLSTVIPERGKDVLHLRNQIVEAAERQLGQKLGRELAGKEIKPGTANPEAWSLVQQAKALEGQADTLRWTLGDTTAAQAALVEADSLLTRASELDDAWLEPVIERGWVVARRGGLRPGSHGTYGQTLLDSGLVLADQALRRQPGNPAALELRGSLRVVLTYTADSLAVDTLRREAAADLDRAVAADSNRVWAWISLAELFRTEGRFAEASQAAQHALRADPFLINGENEILYIVAHTWLELEEVDRANKWVDAGRRRFPADYFFPAQALVILAGPGEAARVPAVVDTAWALCHQVARLYGMKTFAFGRLEVAAVLAQVGQTDSARAVIRRTRENTPESAWGDYYEANARVQLGDTARAIELLGRYLETYPSQRAYIARDWWWKPLREDPRFKALVRGSD
jgi:adenylate cyclase